jgi:hypothetical protein
LVAESLTGAEAKDSMKGLVFNELTVAVASSHQILFENEGEDGVAE